MNTVHIEFGRATGENLRKVKALLDQELLHNPNWCGAEFEITLDDHTWIDTRNEHAGVVLLGQVLCILNGEDD